VNRFLAALVLGTFSFLSQADDLRDSIDADYQARLGPLFLHFHQNPELSNLEFETAASQLLEPVADAMKGALDCFEPGSAYAGHESRVR